MADKKAAQEFLDTLGQGPFVFQTYTDSKDERKKQRTNRHGKIYDPNARVLVGTLDKHYDTLAMLQNHGAGVFVQVNSGSARGAIEVTGVRALFVDIDDAIQSDYILGVISAHMPRPSAIVNSSPEKYHVYWRMTDCPLGAFRTMQRQLAVQLATDSSVINLDRVMRLPGFYHLKTEAAHLVTAHCNPSIVCTMAEIQRGGQSAPMVTPTNVASTTVEQDTLDVFGLNIKDTYKKPTVWEAGNRTQAMVAYVGQLVAAGYGAEWIREEMIRTNVEDCRVGDKPKTLGDLELNVLGAVPKFIAKREAENRPLNVPPPPPDIKNKIPQPPADVPAPPVRVAEPFYNRPEDNTLDQWESRYVYITTGGLIGNMDVQGKYSVTTKEDFKTDMSNVRANAKTLMYVKWMASPRRKTVRDVTYVPNGPKIVVEDGVEMFNIYEPAKITPVTAATFDFRRVEPFIHHLEIIFPDTPEYTTFTQWLATTVTQPEYRVPWAPFLISEPGAGKGFLQQVIAKLVGEHNSALIGSDRLVNQFNSFMADTTFVCIDEIEISTSKRATANLKTLMTEPRLEINKKVVSEKQRRVYPNFIIFANRPNVAVIEDKDRRFWVHKWKGVQPEDYYVKLFEWKENPENIRHLLWWVTHIDLKSFKRSKAPVMTQTKRDIIDNNLPDYAFEMVDAIRHREGPYQADVIAFKTVVMYSEKRVGRDLNAADRNLLTEIWGRYTEKPTDDIGRVTIKGLDRVRCRCIRNYDNVWLNGTKEQWQYEATRAHQMVVTPESVDPPDLKAVPRTEDAG